MSNFSSPSSNPAWIGRDATLISKDKPPDPIVSGFASALRLGMVIPAAAAPILLSAAVFLITFKVSASLPVLADGSLHAKIVQEIARGGNLNTPTISYYPPLYHVLGAQFYSLVGEVGLKLISPLSIALSGLFLYLIAHELTGSRLVGIGAQALAAFSPILIQYSSTILMEPLLVATILFGAHALLVASRNRNTRLVVFAAVAVGGAAATKQVGLVLPVVAVLYFLSSRAGWRRTILLGVTTIAIIIGPYLFMYGRADALINPGPVPPSILKQESEGIFGRISHGDRWRSLPEWSWQIDQEVNSTELYEVGTSVHEQRHIYWHSLLDWGNFIELHSLYPSRFLTLPSVSMPWVLRALNISMMIGFSTALVLSLRDRRWLILALSIFLSYPLMNYGSDTKRLFLHLSMVAAIFPMLALWIFHKSLMAGGFNKSSLWGRFYSLRAVLSRGVIGAFAILVIFEAVSLGFDQMRVMGEMRNTQGGGFASEGGIESVRVTGEWLRQNSLPNEGFMAASAYEWEYYSDRPDLWWQGLDYRLYFLPAERIDHFLRLADARYVIIRTNQLVEDADWNHIELVPLSFQTKIQRLYAEAYLSPYGDIRVYRVPVNTSSG